MDTETIQIESMVEAGVLHGRKHSVLNPKMQKYVFATRRGVDVIDLSQTWELLGKAIAFLKSVMEKKQQVLVVATQPAARDLAKELADKFKWPYVNERWLGGTLTNFKTISKRIDYLKKLRKDKESGALEKKYTKKERLLFNREFERLSHLFSGIEDMPQLPAAVLVVDVAEHPTTIRETSRMGIPVVGLINTDGDPDMVQYPIPCNDNARSSISWILGKIIEELSKSQNAGTNTKT